MTRDPEQVRRHLLDLEHGEQKLLLALEPLVGLGTLWPGLARLARSAENAARKRAAFIAARLGREPPEMGPPQSRAISPSELAHALREVALRFRLLELGWTALADARPLADLGLSTFAAKALREVDVEQRNFTPPHHAAADRVLARDGSRPHSAAAALRDRIWVPLVGAVLIGAVGLVSWLAHSAWLLPSLGPSAYLLAIQPSHPNARPYNVVVGHLVGLGAGFLSVVILGCRTAPGISSHHLVLSRAFAAMLAMAISLFAVLALKASHPPAGATTLLVTLGALQTSADAVHILIGVAILAALGEIARLIRLGHIAFPPLRAPVRLRPRRA